MESISKKRNGAQESRPKTQSEKDVELGEAVGKIVTGLWNSQQNPGKVFVNGRRIHHGEIGLVGALFSALLDEPKWFGFFKQLMEDDKQDAKLWFSGEKLA